MKQWKKLLPALLSLALLVSCGPKRPGTDTSVGDVSAPGTADPFVFTRDSLPRLDGSTSTAPMAQAMCAVLLGEEREQVADLVQFSRTTQSYRNLMAGAADLLLAAEPAPEVAQELKQEGEWLLTPFATDALVFVVNEDNPVDSLTTEQVRKIYTGQITNWKEVGGEDLDIIPFQRNSEAGSQTLMEKLVMDGLEMMDAPEAWVPDSMMGLLEAVREYDNSPSAIGYTVYYYANDMEMAKGLKVLTIDGVSPSAEAIQAGEYPFLNPYYVAMAKDRPQDDPTHILYDWLLGPDGRRLAEELGYVPASDAGEPLIPVEVDWSKLDEQEKPLPDIGGRWYQERVEQLRPSQEYGQLVPFEGAAGYFSWQADNWPETLIGLMTTGGKVVMDPVCSEISRLYYTDDAGDSQTLPVWELEKGDPERGSPGNGALIALAAQDGSWVTEFRYWGVKGTPVGIFAGDGHKLYLLRQEDGTEKASWSWDQLGIARPESFPWFTGDAYETAQWYDGGFFLGCWGENWDKALFLDPETGEVTALAAQDWYDRIQKRYQDTLWWDSKTDGQGQVTLTYGTDSFTFPSPLPEEEFPYVTGGDRVIFNDTQGDRCAVSLLNGQEVLPAQDGQVEALQGDEASWLAVRKDQGRQWNIYDWKGELSCTLEGEEDSWLSLSGPLLELRCRNYTAYYEPESGTCVFRTWFSLGDRGGEAQEPAG